MRTTNRRLGAAVLLAGLLMTVLAGTSHAAAPQAIGIPGVDVCAKDAPYPATPAQGLPGMLAERPIHITDDADPKHIWSTGGFAGLSTHPYDLGCALDPTSWTRITGANTDAKIGNSVAGFGQAVTSLTDSLDRRAWQPGYVLSFLHSFAERATEVVNVRILTPMLGLGILLAAILVAWRCAPRGDMGAAANSLGWTLFVLSVAAGILAMPLALPILTQSAGASVAGALNQSASASDGATNSVVEAVHYQGWLRRSFGSSDSEVAHLYGMKLLASQRLSWTEYDHANSLKGDARGKYLDGLIEKKSNDFKDVATKVKDADPIAYRALTGAEPQGTVSFLEVAFALSAGLFRMACAFLVVICVLMIALICIFWLVATPWMVTPWGESVGRGLIDSGVRAIKYVVEAATAAWLFTIYLQAALAPGMSAWWSLLLLVIGASIFWLALAPMRKVTALVTLGRVSGAGWLAGLAKAWLMTNIAGRIAGKAAGKMLEEREEEPRQSEDVPAPLPTAPDPVYNIFSPGPAFNPDVRTQAFGVPRERTLAAASALPPGQPVYQRADTTSPSAPPPNATTAPGEPFAPYQRADDDEGARP